LATIGTASTLSIASPFIDGRTFEPLAILNAANMKTYPLDGLINGAPYEEFWPAHWAEANEQITAARVEWVKDQIKALFARTLPATLLRLNALTPSALLVSD
jgi:hypothetical protein